MDREKLRALTEEAISVSVAGTELPGIVDAALRNVTVSPKHLEQVAAQLNCRRSAEIACPAEVELFLRASNHDVFRSLQKLVFRVQIAVENGHVHAKCNNLTDWAVVWERGIEPIKQAAIGFMKRDVWNLDATLSEDSYTFKSAMVLLASEMVGPFAARLASFLGYPVSLVQVIGARLQEAGIWGKDEVRAEKWFDPDVGGITLLLDVMVAEGKLIRKWSEERNDYAYCEPAVRIGSHLTV